MTKDALLVVDIAPHPVAIVRAVDVYPETDAHPADVDAATGGAR